MTRTRIAPILIFAAGALMTPQKALAARECTIADARGNYGFQFFGFIAAPNAPPDTPPVAFAETGIMMVDGHGKVSGESTFMIGGVGKLEHSFWGTVHINPNCTGTSSVEDSLGFKNLTSYWAILKPGEEILLTSTNPGSAVNGRLERRQRPQRQRED
jgi:hypothetical protein